MDGKQLRRLKPELDTFLERYLPLFGREQNHEHAQRFVQGLLGGLERRNTENIAEVVQGGVVRTMQKFVAQGVWDDAVVLEEVRAHVAETLADERGTINIDETGFPKKGKKSVGVKRQYSGTLGRVDNCQIGVCANYWSTKGHTFIDRKLYLPEEWCQDRQRREEAGVPDNVVFRTKPELGVEMIRTAVHEGVPFQWVGGDSVYGDSPTFVEGVRELGKWYVLDVSSEARVWLDKPEMIMPGRRAGRAKPESKPISVAAAVAQLPPSTFRRITVSHGSQGPIVYEYAEMTVWFSEEGCPTEEAERLLVRRTLNQDAELKYHRSNAPPKVTLQRLAEQRGGRWTIEEDIKAGKGQCGLDEYETRGWTGWHHHTALSVLALLFLVLQKVRFGKKREPDDSPGSSRGSSSPTRSASLGRGRNRRVEQLANGAKSRRKGMSQSTTSRRTAAALQKKEKVAVVLGYRINVNGAKMAVRPITHYLGAFPLKSKALQQPFLDRVEAASGKPVLLQSDSNFAGHATIRVATNEQPAHVLFYKPAKEPVLPYLVAFQCEFALRTILADPAAQFDLVAKNNMLDDVAALMTNYHTGKTQVPASAVLQMAGTFGNGLGLQLRSMPITMRIDTQIHDDHPELRAFQQQSIDSQLQENMQALSPRAKELAPEEIIRPNASMNAAFAKFFSELWNAPTVFAPYIAAGYSQVAAELLGYHEQIPADSNHDRELVDAWAKHLGLDRWFKTRAR